MSAVKPDAGIESNKERVKSKKTKQKSKREMGELWNE